MFLHVLIWKHYIQFKLFWVSKWKDFVNELVDCFRLLLLNFEIRNIADKRPTRTITLENWVRQTVISTYYFIWQLLNTKPANFVSFRQKVISMLWIRSGFAIDCRQTSELTVNSCNIRSQVNGLLRKEDIFLI